MFIIYYKVQTKFPEIINQLNAKKHSYKTLFADLQLSW